MREAILILPADNVSANEIVRESLLSSFGGYSEDQCVGAWRDDTGKVHHDRNNRWTIGMDDTADNRQTLRTIAHGAAINASQLCVYVRHPDGEVEFVEPTYVLARG